MAVSILDMVKFTDLRKAVSAWFRKPNLVHGFSGLNDIQMTKTLKHRLMDHLSPLSTDSIFASLTQIAVVWGSRFSSTSGFVIGCLQESVINLANSVVDVD